MALAAGGTGCVHGSHDTGATYASEEDRAQAKRDYPNRGKGKGKGKENGKGKGKGKGDKRGKGTE
jgi:hypothetical protein